jgi:hypothetical protein
MKRIAAVLTIIGAAVGFAAPSAMASTATLCAHVNVNGTDVVNQCISQ